MWRWKGEEVTKQKSSNITYSTGHTNLYTYFAILAFFLLRICHYYRWTATHFDLHSALFTVVQWEFFNVPHILWHGTSVFMDNSDYLGQSNLLLLSSGSITTLYNDLGVSRPGIKLRSSTCEVNVLEFKSTWN